MKKKLLFLLVYFVAITSLASGLILLLKPDGSSFGLSVTILKGTPFSDFSIPGLLLFLVIGVSHLLALVLRILHHPKTYVITFIAGILLLIWILLQFEMIGLFQWLYAVYFFMGLLICFLSRLLIRSAYS